MSNLYSRVDISGGSKSTSPPVKIWSVIGAIWIALFIYCMGSWVLGPDFQQNTTGRDQAPEWLVMYIRTIEVAMVLLTVWLLYRFVISPYLKTKSFSFDGLFYLACGTLVIQEPWLNAIRPQLLYNTVFINFGSWMGYLPGVVSPVAEGVPVSFAFAYLGYFWIVAGPAYCGSLLLRRAKEANLDASVVKLIAWCFLGFVLFDVAIESIILRTGMFIYPSTIPGLTLFAGQTYQLPLYEIISWAGTYTFLASVHFFRNDKGECYSDRGFASLKLSRRAKTFVRWLAIVGFCQMGMLFIYNIPYMFWSMHGGKFTVSEQTHPWLTAGLCGESTAYDCPGPQVPIARRDSPTNRVGEY